MAPDESPPDRPGQDSPDTEGNDGVCFTAGLKAAVVGAGTIHAYLAARRPPPRVVAGISLGALNAAAMQRAYREIAGAEGQAAEVREAARWSWFRQYLDALANRPFRVLWRTLPHQSDFFADMIPIRHSAVPPALEDDERSARRDLYLKVKLGRWMAQLPITVRLLASGLVNYVRTFEKYPLPNRLWSGLGLLANVAWLILQVAVRVCISPHFLPQHQFRPTKTAPDDGKRRRRIRIPGIAWLNLFSVSLVIALFVPVVVLILVLAPPNTLTGGWLMLGIPAAAVAGLAGLIRFTARYRRIVQQWWITRQFVLPLFGLGAYIYSLINLLCLAALLAVGGWTFYELLIDTSVSSMSRDVWLAVSVVWAGAALGFAPFLALAEIREWLIKHHLLEQWPRPLFGWAAFLGFSANLASLVTGVVLGLLFIWNAQHFDSVPHTIVFTVVTPITLVAIPLIPLAPLVAPVFLWRSMRDFADARRGWRKRVAWGLSIIMSLGLLALSWWLFSWLVSGFDYLLGLDDNPSPLEATPSLWHLFRLAAGVVMVTWFVFVTVITQPIPRRWVGEALLDKVGLKQGLVPDLYLRLMLTRLFHADALSAREPSAPPEVVEEGSGYPSVVLVAAPLQAMERRGQRQTADQVWARPGTPLVHALRCALSVPPLLAPVQLREQEELANWGVPAGDPNSRDTGAYPGGIDLVDGSVIRQNPLPALFGSIRNTHMATQMAAHNDRDHPALHVVYGVPTQGRAPATANEGGPSNTIVDVALASLRLAQRRDTQLEVTQTNVIAKLAQITPRAGSAIETHDIFAGEIAPEQDVIFKNNLRPARSEVLDGVAMGCRRTIEKLYADRLGRWQPSLRTAGGVRCSDFLRDLRGSSDDPPGLPEICSRCSGVLQPPGASARPTAAVDTCLSAPPSVYGAHPQLGGDRPRLVFVASGGVFRGAFHIGMLAALRAGDVKPDLIVGASVGTLMGGALGAMFSRPDRNTLEQLVDAFVNVDERVALTHTLKAAARELGIRGRSIKLSPRRVRRLVLRGGRRDSGFATTGAPSALIDAISDLFLIPQRQTQDIAASFVAGDVTGAVKALVAQLRTETIRRLEIEQALVGASLLEQLAADLLSDGTRKGRLQRQPFQQSGIAFYGTTTNLTTESALLLGGNALYPEAPYDFVEAALASSAFPAVFAPRAESSVFPGTGRSDVLYSDGGMFDNLPFVPAIELLSRAQLGYRRTSGVDVTGLELLQRRLQSPDLLIAGALNPRPEADEAAGPDYDSTEAVRRRVAALQNDVKIRSFDLAARRVDRLLTQLEEKRPSWLLDSAPHFLDGIVNAAVLPVFPASADHVNGTFSFCASTGLTRRRVQKSIADGCYQTLSAVANQQIDDGTTSWDLAARSVAALTKVGLVPRIQRTAGIGAGSDKCPYFDRDGTRFRCPFSNGSTQSHGTGLMRDVYFECTSDALHWRAARGRA